MSALIARDGAWSMRLSDTCSHLDTETNLCQVHGTPDKPQTCVNFSALNCWYKRNFSDTGSPDVLQLDLERFQELLSLLEFDRDGNITGWPGWEEVKAKLDGAEGG